MPTRTQSAPIGQVERWEHSPTLDRLARSQLRRVKRILPAPLRRALSGVSLGHPLHPAVAQLPVGAWLGTAVLDLRPRDTRTAATMLTAVGVATAIPSALTGWTDWSTQTVEQRRVGLVHAVGNVTAVLLYAGSLVARLRRRDGVGRALAAGGLVAAGGAAYLGGHMASHGSRWQDGVGLVPSDQAESAERPLVSATG